MTPTFVLLAVVSLVNFNTWHAVCKKLMVSVATRTCSYMAEAGVYQLE